MDFTFAVRIDQALKIFGNGAVPPEQQRFVG